jgi:chemotaxis protein MotB
VSINPPITHMPGGGYVVGFGNHEPNNESLEQQRARLQHRAGRDVEAREDDDMGENDWPVSYADMVTLLMAFFIILTAATVNNPKTTVGVTPEAQHEVRARPSPFDGQGLTIAEMGMPANQDDVDSEFDDPEANGATTDPAPSGEAYTANPKPPEPQTEVTEEPQAEAQPEVPPEVKPEPAAEPNQLAQELQQMVQQNNLAGQVEVLSTAQSVTVRISDKILFASGKALLEDGGRALVQRLSAILASTGGIISIEGHTDNIPIKTAQYPSNWELSAARAAMVVRELVAMGLPGNRLRAIGYAETKPVAQNNNSEGRASNRRVELVITSAAPKP